MLLCCGLLGLASAGRAVGGCRRQWRRQRRRQPLLSRPSQSPRPGRRASSQHRHQDTHQQAGEAREGPQAPCHGCSLPVACRPGSGPPRQVRCGDPATTQGRTGAQTTRKGEPPCSSPCKPSRCPAALQALVHICSIAHFGRSCLWQAQRLKMASCTRVLSVQPALTAGSAIHSKVRQTEFMHAPAGVRQGPLPACSLRLSSRLPQTGERAPLTSCSCSSLSCSHAPGRLCCSGHSARGSSGGQQWRQRCQRSSRAAGRRTCSSQQSLQAATARRLRTTAATLLWPWPRCVGSRMGRPLDVSTCAPCSRAAHAFRENC